MITFINVFTVHPDNQQRAFKAIQKVYEEVVRHQPGFIAAKLFVSDDGTRVTAVANWESKEHLEALRKTQGFQDLHDEEFYAAIVSNEPHIYSTFIEVDRQM